MEQEKNKMEQGKSKQQRMRELVELLNRARKAYEQDNTEIMSNYEYDRLYDELEELEKELGTKMANSPTVNVGYEVVSGLPKERHERPMLSLDKTKEVERLKEFLGTKKAMISWKLDGLTIVLTYQGGELVKAVTRGNGIEGEVITNNATVVSISAETQPSALQVFVELVEDDQRQNRAKVRALRRTFLSGRDKTVLHDAIA